MFFLLWTYFYLQLLTIINFINNFKVLRRQVTQQVLIILSPSTLCLPNLNWTLCFQPVSATLLISKIDVHYLRLFWIDIAALRSLNLLSIKLFRNHWIHILYQFLYYLRLKCLVREHICSYQSLWLLLFSLN